MSVESAVSPNRNFNLYDSCFCVKCVHRVHAPCLIFNLYSLVCLCFFLLHQCRKKMSKVVVFPTRCDVFNFGTVFSEVSWLLQSFLATYSRKCITWLCSLFVFVHCFTISKECWNVNPTFLSFWDTPAYSKYTKALLISSLRFQRSNFVRLLYVLQLFQIESDCQKTQSHQRAEHLLRITWVSK